MGECRMSAVALAVALLATQGSIPVGAQIPGAIPTAELGTLVLSPAESSAGLASTHLVSHSDSLAFQNVTRSTGSRGRLRILDATGSFEAHGSDVTLEGIRRVAEPGAGLVSWSEIQRVQVCGSAVGQGAKIGGVTGGLIGLGLAAIASTVSFGLGTSDEPSAGDFVAVTCIFAGGGAMVGGMVGALTPKWKTVHSWAGF
jgi:hypothetical protein